MRAALLRAGAEWAASPRGPRRLRALRALCDTWVPSVRPPSGADGFGGFWRRTASDVETHLALAGWLATRVPPSEAAEVDRLLDALALAGFRRLPGGARSALLGGLARASADAAAGLEDLRKLTLMLHYGLADESGGNPSWAAIGYPGPPEVSGAPPRPLATVPPAANPTEIDADVCVVGSGAGGGVVAAVLAEAGLDVVVLEAAADLQGGALPRRELDAMTSLYWRDGYTARTHDRNVTLLAGAALGGGTTVNWATCVRPPLEVRSLWAERHGLKGLDPGDFDAHLDAVLARIGARNDCSDRNGANEALRRGADALGWSWRPALRNADPATYDPASAGHTGYGDRTGSKQGTVQTYLADAVASGARVLTGCRADRILTRAGRARGVAATRISSEGGARTAVTVHAPVVVAAGGALETPVLLLRSAMGGPAVGHHLRLHPVVACVGFYAEPQRGWWGPPQAVIVDELAQATNGHGFLVECPHYGTGLSAASLPWRSGRDHKLLMGRLERGATFISVVRDHGAGRVSIDASGNGVVHYPVDDMLDRTNLGRAFGAMAQLHQAAGARAVLDLAPQRSLWRSGQDLEAWITRVGAIPAGPGGRSLFSAHQMGSARMGTDESTSVADPEGQVHDLPGVWIGDASAFPTAVGVNPMVTVLALARRTAHAVLAARP